MNNTVNTLIQAKRFAEYNKIEKPSIVLKSTNPQAYILAKEYEDAKAKNPDLERAVNATKKIRNKMNSLY